MRKKIADKKEVGAFLTTVLRDEEANVKDRLKVSECLLKLAEEDDTKEDGKVEIVLKVAQ